MSGKERGLSRESRVRMSVAAVSLALIVGLAGIQAPIAAAAEIPRFQPIAPPPLTADAVFVVDATSDTELFAVAADEPLPPASLTKVVSALVVLDHADLDARVEIAPEDLVDPEESQVGLVPGDRLSVRDLFVGMLVPSGNDATLALARFLGERALGENATRDDAVAWFVTAMNEKAAALGAKQSRFANPTGIDAEGHVMSARDVAIVTEAALAQPFFAETVAMREAVLESESRPDGYPVATTNQLLTEGLVDGVKTGTTAQAGGCLVTSYDVGGNRILAVVLGSDLAETADGVQDNTARYNDTRTLIEAVNTDYVWLDPAAPGVLDGLVEEMGVWDVQLDGGDLQPVPATGATALRYRLVLAPPAEPRAAAGELLLFVGDELLAARPAVQSND